MKIIKLYVHPNSEMENGIGIKVINQIEVTRADKTYSGNGVRIPIDDFEKPIKTGLDLSKLYYDIWTTEENAKESVAKCVYLLIKDFDEMNKKWEITKDAISKAKDKFKQSNNQESSSEK